MIAIERRRREGGSALVVTGLILALLAALAIDSLQSTESESAGAGRSRSARTALAAADAGVQLALSRLDDNPPNLTPIDLALANTTVQSRARSETTPQPLVQQSVNASEEGYSLNVDSGVGHVARIFVVGVTAEGGSGAVAELETRLTRSGVEGRTY